MNYSVHFTNGHDSRGFSLVEVMVSLIVLAIGVLGMGALQIAGLRNNQYAYVRAQATELAYDISDRMRANITALASYTGSKTADDCVAKSCTPAQMAGYDLAQWNAALARLPDGAGTITVSGTIYSIAVSWTESDSTGPVKFTTSFQP